MDPAHEYGKAGSYTLHEGDHVLYSFLLDGCLPSPLAHKINYWPY